MDKEAFASELEAYQSMLYRVAYTILRDDDACRDALQDAALKAWEKRFTLREPNFFRTWITRILINACHDIHRKRRRLVCMERLPRPRAGRRLGVPARGTAPAAGTALCRRHEL